MSTLKPLRKPVARSAARRSIRPAARRGIPPSRLVAVGVVAAAVLVLGMLIARARAGAPSAVPVDQAVRTLRAPTGQTAEGYWYKGGADAPVTVIVFGDFQCPSCRAAHEQIEAVLDRDYVETGKIRVVFHDFPLAMHPNAVPTARAARAAGAQGHFWAMHDLLYARQDEWAGDRDVTQRLLGYATALGLDQQAFKRALNDGQYAAAITAAIADGTSLGINATPTYRVDGTNVGAGGLKAAIDAALRAKGR